MKAICLLIGVLSLITTSSNAQAPKTNIPVADFPSDSIINFRKPQKSITYNAVTVAGNRINYKAATGTIILKNANDSPTASIFYAAYFKEGEKDASQRPITFLYNGGPGSSTIWLHMGAFGPQRAYLEDTARTKAPYKTVNNDYSLLDASDLVFIDAPGTGFSRIITKELGGAGKPSDFFGTDPDANAFASFISQFLSDFDRWTSPKYLFGESYGTFRSAALAEILVTRKHISLNGIILLSQILNLGNSPDNPHAVPGDDNAYQLVLPTYAAVAWYHHKLPGQYAKLETLLSEVERFSMTDYDLALKKGSTLDSVSFNEIAVKLHNYTGLSVEYIKKANLRVEDQQFQHELLGNEGLVTGRLDARFSGYAMNRLAEISDYDPMDSYIGAPFVAAFNHYVRAELKYGNGLTFNPSGPGVYGQWDYRHEIPDFRDPQENIYPNTMTALGHAMSYDPNLKVMLNSGYFDLGTPYFQGIYEMHHLPIPAALQKNIEYKLYFSGHMVYLHPESLKLLHDNVAKFIGSTH